MTAANRVGLLQVSLAGVLWGTGGLGVQVVRDHVPMTVLTISAWRMGIAALVLAAAVLALRGGPRLRTLVRDQPRRVVAVGSATAAYQALYFGAVVTAGVTVATVVSLGVAPVLLTVADSLHRGRPVRDRVPVVVTALVGLVLVSAFAGHGTTGPQPAVGVALALASGAAYAFGTALGEPLARSADPLPVTTATTTVGAVVLLPTAFLGGPVATTDPVALLTLAYLGALTLALAYGLLYAGLRTADRGAAVVATLLEPVTAALLAAALLGERLGPWGVVGMLLILAAVAGLGRSGGDARSPVAGGPLTPRREPDKVSGPDGRPSEGN